jgi:hypothetical protein
VTQVAFQAALARLLVEDDFRDSVRAGGEAALDGDLTPVERRRLVAVASDPGLDVTRTLHDGWRFSKVLLMLPATCAVLGNERLSAEVHAFWKTRVPRSLYFHAEAIAFCDWLLARSGELGLEYLDELAAFERASLVLRSAWADAPPPPQQVRFRHDPQLLLAAIAEGRPLAGIPERPCVLVGSSPLSGEVEWRLAAETAVTRSEGQAESLPLTPAIS